MIIEQAERERKERERRAEERKKKEIRILRYVFSMLAKLAKADGRVDEKEVHAAKRVFERFDFAASRQAFCSTVFNESKSNKRSIYWYADQFGKLVSDESICLFLYEVLWDVACADGILHPQEKRILREICPFLHLQESYFTINYRRRRNTFSEREEKSAGASSAREERTREKEREYHSGRSSIREAYAILLCVETASDDEVRAAYHAAALKYHPDRLRQNGVSEDKIAKATEKMAQINAAWRDIKEHRGLGK